MKTPALKDATVSTSAEDETYKADREAFVARLESLIPDRGESAFARRAGISVGGLRNVKRHGNPGRDILVKIARAAGVRVEWLATGVGEPTVRAPETPVNTGLNAPADQGRNPPAAPDQGGEEDDYGRLYAIGTRMIALVRAENADLDQEVFTDLVRVALAMPEGPKYDALIVRLIRHLARKA